MSGPGRGAQAGRRQGDPDHRRPDARPRRWPASPPPAASTCRSSANAPGFTPQLLASPAGPALRRTSRGLQHRPVRRRGPRGQRVSAAFEKHYPKGTPKSSVDAGYAQAQLMHEVLQRACDNKDLTRAGVVKALREMYGVDTGGLVPARSTTPSSACRRRARSTSRRSTRRPLAASACSAPCSSRPTPRRTSSPPPEDWIHGLRCA